MKDVAEAAGVHPGTVSRVLNQRTRHLVRDETALRVEQVAGEMGYEANQIARGLRMRQSNTVGVLIPDLTNPLFPPIVRGIEDLLDPLGYTALVASTDWDSARERRAFATLATRQVDGFIAATTPSNLKLFGEAADDGTALVLINRTLGRRKVYAVTPDDRTGGRLAADHLVQLGHRRIGHLAGPQELSPGRQRHRSFKAALAKHGIELPDDRVAVARSFTEGAGEDPARALLEPSKKITAIFAANDLLALDCLAVLVEQGRRCPQHVSIMGFNDMPFASRFDPPLTTIHFSPYQLGRRAAELLMEQVEKRGGRPRTVVCEVSLAARGSTVAT